VLTNRGAIEYTSKCRCWAVQVMAEEHRTRGFRIGVNIRLLGFGMNLDEPFQGGIGVGSGMF
jgi:hypothetical protein